ncbi:hypothetical protein ACFODT_14960 [Vibrio zhugei]|uniref:Nicotinamide riboside transporter PnuC n=1 Tax=Vibrio zhugei TaxID=2479546 RepID=A0ABV7CCH8_9VIBR|nr:hypothetical protein [Vibrio zhugei]
MDVFLQLWGGLFYLVNKILFAIAEVQRSSQRQRRLKIVGWSIYILGVPPWVMILVGHDNWIAASIETGGIPAMAFGLYVLIKQDVVHSFYDRLTSLITYCFIILGVGYSFYEYGGITSINQWLELGVMVGFLLGGYLLAKARIGGWLCFAVMNLSMGTLMLIQGKPILAIQQTASLCFVLFGLVSMYRNQKVQAVA